MEILEENTQWKKECFPCEPKRIYRSKSKRFCSSFVPPYETMNNNNCSSGTDNDIDMFSSTIESSSVTELSCSLNSSFNSTSSGQSSVKEATCMASQTSFSSSCDNEDVCCSFRCSPFFTPKKRKWRHILSPASSTSSCIAHNLESVSSSVHSSSKQNNKLRKKTSKTHSKMSIDQYFSKSSNTNKKLTLSVEEPNTSIDLIQDNKIPPLFELVLSPRQPLKQRNAGVKRSVSGKKEQTYIDIGQKDFGHVTCPTCCMVYTKSQPEDEAQHAKYHHKVMQKLCFGGWKNERVLQEFHDGHIIMVKDTDHYLHLKKLSEIKEVVDAELGFNCGDLYQKADRQAYFFISAKRIVGFALALPITKGFPIIPLSEEKENSSPEDSWCCSEYPEHILCGISRIWVFAQNRRTGIATRIVDCIRHHFLYGCVIGKNKIAFSDPTPNGRIFAEAYTDKHRVLVFR